jgi:anti-sigma regulatory factor (Ser/Thr protein kinase)
MILVGGCHDKREASVTRAMNKPLSRPPAHAEALVYRAELAAVRDFITTRARRAGLSPQRVKDLVLAVSELAANTLAHTNGPGTLLVWTTDDEIVCQVDDTGQLSDPEPGAARPEPDALGGGRGLWVVRQICDRVEIRAGEDGTSIRTYMRRTVQPA